MRWAIMLVLLWTGAHAVENDYGSARAKAQREGKLIYVLITTPQCRWCRRFEEQTLVDKGVKEGLEEMAVTVELTRDADDYPETLKAPVVPMHFFLTADERVLVKMPGYWNVENFTSIMNDAKRRADNAVRTDK